MVSRQILSLLRLPISPPSQLYYFIIKKAKNQEVEKIKIKLKKS
jgi:hypothetical protein